MDGELSTGIMETLFRLTPFLVITKVNPNLLISREELRMVLCMVKLSTLGGGMELSLFVRKQKNALIMESFRRTLDHLDMSTEVLLMILSRPKSMMMDGI